MWAWPDTRVRDGRSPGAEVVSPAPRPDWLAVLAADPAAAFRDRAGQLLDAWTSLGHRRPAIEIADCPLAASVMAAAAALEVAVHGWDISRACGQRQPIPHALAIDLLAIAPVLVPRAGRHPLFAAPVAVAATAGPSDRLAAFLGRSPA